MPSAGRTPPPGVIIDGDSARDGTITVVHLGPDKTTVEIREYYDDALCDEWVCNPEAGIELDRVVWDRLVAAVSAYEAKHRCFKCRFGDDKRCTLEQGHAEFHDYR